MPEVVRGLEPRFSVSVVDLLGALSLSFPVSQERVRIGLRPPTFWAERRSQPKADAVIDREIRQRGVEIQTSAHAFRSQGTDTLFPELHGGLPCDQGLPGVSSFQAALTLLPIGINISGPSGS